MALGPEAELQYNSGVLLYRGNPCMQAFFQRWEAIWLNETTARGALLGLDWWRAFVAVGPFP